ncbi:MAG: hypothetical protein RL398_56 [Planctomycetota bacterium]|jgi:hypothetical protein
MNRSILTLAALWCAGWAMAQDPAPKAEPKWPAPVVDALATAKQKNKRVLVVWPGEGDAGAALTKALKGRALSRQLLYEFVQAPLAKADEAALVGLDAAPGLVALAADGKRLAAWTSKDLDPLDAEKLSKALEPLHAAPLDGQALFDAALATAKKEQKRVLVHFDAPW